MQSRNILIIDDDSAIRETIGDVLESRGYRPLLAADGGEALQMLKIAALRPSVILLDMMMPKVNGWEFLDEQRQDPNLAGIPVIVCSAYVESGKSVHTEAFLAKPLELKTLMNTIEAFCDWRARPLEVPPAAPLH